MNWWAKAKGAGKPVNQIASQIERLLDKVAFQNQIDSNLQHFSLNADEPMTGDKKQKVKQY